MSLEYFPILKLEHIKSLDGLRSIAIILVIVWHYFNNQINPNLFGGFMSHMKLLTFWTWSGVDLFFVLSGFLIGRILINHRSSPRYFQTFYMRRVFRIFPAYYFILLAFVMMIYFQLDDVLPWLTSAPLPLYSYFLYIQNFFMINEGFGAHWLGITWSLAIEEQFYLLLPLLIYSISPKFRPYMLILGIVMAPILRSISSDMSAYVLLPMRMDSLLLGVLIAHFYLNGQLQNWFENRSKILVAISMICFAFLFVLRLYSDENIGGVFIHSLLGILFSALLILILTTNRDTIFNRFMSISFFGFIAKISYMLYLSHQLISGIMHQFILNQIPQMNNFNDLMVTTVALLITVGFCSLSYRYFEKPILQKGKNFQF